MADKPDDKTTEILEKEALQRADQALINALNRPPSILYTDPAHPEPIANPDEVMACLMECLRLRPPGADASSIDGCNLLLEVTRADIAQILINNGAKVNVRDGANVTPLHRAAAHNLTDVMKVLIDNRADINAQDTNNETPLFKAAEHNSSEAVQLLVNKLADVNVIDTQGKSALMANADSPPVQFAEQDAKEAADGKDPVLAMQTAERKELAFARQAAIAKLIINAGNKNTLNATDKYGNTAMHFAAGVGNTALIAELSQAGLSASSPNADGKPPIFWAKSAEAVKALVAAGADVNASDNDNMTPVFFAPSEVLHALVDKGARLDVVDKFQRTPLSCLHVPSDPEKAKELVTFMISHGAKIEARDKNGKTPFLETAASGSKDAMNALIAAGADVKAKDEDGRNALHLLRQFLSDDGYDPMPEIQALIKAGVAIDGKDKYGMTPLMDTLMFNKPVRTKAFIEAGADIDARDHAGESPLYHAMDPQMFTLLVEKGADISARTNAGNTIFHRIAGGYLKFDSPADTLKLLKEHVRAQDYRDAERQFEHVINISNDVGETPLLVALYNDKKDWAGALIDAGAYVGEKTISGNSYLFECKSMETLKLLLDKGVSLTEKSGRNGTILHSAADSQMPFKEPEELLKLLEKRVPNVKDFINTADVSGETALMRAVVSNNKGLAEALIAHGADVNARDHIDATALTNTITWGRPEMTQLLLAHGARVDDRAKELLQTIKNKPPSYFTPEDKANLDKIQKLMDAAEKTQHSSGDVSPMDKALRQFQNNPATSKEEVAQTVPVSVQDIAKPLGARTKPATPEEKANNLA